MRRIDKEVEFQGMLFAGDLHRIYDRRTVLQGGRIVPTIECVCGAFWCATDREAAEQHVRDYLPVEQS